MAKGTSTSVSASAAVSGPVKDESKDITDAPKPTVVADRESDVQSRPDVVSTHEGNEDGHGEGHEVPPYAVP